ncbi:MAG: CerR family C-terminal domain-containing protein [Moraxellaceae bacterium]|nr:CerR family C-terminal domain-containing protein [Moraxellaceae bacterium]
MYRIRPIAAVGTDSSASTRAALIAAATPLFASDGYEATRTRDIADKAKANVAAINYHFGSKMGLYQAVMKAQADRMIEEFPLATDALSSAAPEERLHWLVRNLLRRVLVTQGGNQPTRMCVREFVEPTEALDYMVKEIVSHQFAIMKQVVGDVLGRKADDDELNLVAESVISQCFHYGMAEPMLTRLGVKIPRTDEEIDALAVHITRFSLAGIAAVRVPA